MSLLPEQFADVVGSLKAPAAEAEPFIDRKSVV